MSFGKGMFLGIAAGIGLSMAVNPVSMRDIRKIKKKAKRMIRSVGGAADGICCKMK